MDGACLRVFPVLWGDVVALAVGVFLQDVDVFAGKAPGDSGDERQLFSEELDASLLRVGRDACWAERCVVQGDLLCLLELLDVRPAVRVAEEPGEPLNRPVLVVGSVV